MCNSLRCTWLIKHSVCDIHHNPTRSRRGNVCNSAHSCHLQSVCDVRHYHIRCGKTKCVWLSTHRTRFIIMNCLWCARHRKRRASLVHAWKNPVHGMCLVLGKNTELWLQWQCEHKRVARMERLGYSRYQNSFIGTTVCIKAPYPRRFLGRVGRTPPPIAHTHFATVQNVIVERG